MINTSPEKVVCNHCTYKLVTIAYQRAPWFRLFREPLKLGMRWLAFWHHIDTKDYQVRTPGCYRCIRFYKTALIEKSVTFRWLHNKVNPIFNSLISRIVTDEERRQSRIYANAASEGRLSEEEVKRWMKGMKAGL